MLVIWLQGIWLPLHGYGYAQTPLWAGIFLLPLTAGFLISGPLAGTLSDRFGARGMATSGMIVFAASLIGLMVLPINFPYWAFAVLIGAIGIGSGMFAAPNTSSIMSSVPARYRGVASGMRSTFQNSGTAVSTGVFFSIMIAGLASTLPKALTSGLVHQGVPHQAAVHVGNLPPTSSLFAALLGVNPLQHALQSSGFVLSSLPASNQVMITGRTFFPHLISGAFHHGLSEVFAFSAVLAVLAGLASLLRGGRHSDPTADEPTTPKTETEPGAVGPVGMEPSPDWPTTASTTMMRLTQADVAISQNTFMSYAHERGRRWH
jgi:MFS family permease